MVIAIFIMWLAFTIPACFILSNKHRGADYYILAVFFPPIGLIVAPFLEKLPAEESQLQAKNLDITNETNNLA